MAYEGDTPQGSAIDRSDRHGHIGWVLLLAGLLVGATLSLRFLGIDQAQPLILGLLAFFAMAGVFFLFAMAIGVVQFSGQTARNDITKLMADTSGDGLVVVEDDGRITYANGAYLAFAGLQGGEVLPVERLFIGAPEVSEAIYRLAQAAREHRTGTEEIRLSPSLNGASASARRTSSRNSSTPSTISIMPPRASCPSSPAAPSSISMRRSPPGSTTISRRSAPAA